MFALTAIIFVLITFIPMKAWSLSLAPEKLSVSKPLFWILPFPSTETIRRIRKLNPDDVKRLLVQFGSHVGLAALGYALLPDLKVQQLNPYVGALLALVFWSLCFDALGCLCQILYAPSGQLIPHPNQLPSRARSLGEFWGLRWNCWTHDWFKQICFEPIKRRPRLGIVLVFLVSGIWHEIIANGVIYFLMGKIIFGNFILFFLIQAFGIFAEKKFRPHIQSTFGRRLFWYSFILIPIPLLGNESMIRILAIAN